jgi:CheY-like chemotaxis protein
MSEDSILSHSHPTTVILVDDNELFLRTLDLRMPGEMAYLLYHDPRQALTRINERPILPPIPQRCEAPLPTLHWPASVMSLDLSLIEQEMYQTERFRRISVLIADFAMPAMNGLELCDQIVDPSVKKILMTGAADQQTALAAFNDGVIDRFVPKNRPTTLDAVVSDAQQLQREYFLDQQHAIQETLFLDPPALLEDPAVIEYFAAERRKNRIVEHYLVGDPPGFICVSARGTLSRFLVLSDTEVTQQVEFAARQEAPLDVVQAIATRSRIGYFFDGTENHSDEPYPWHSFLYPPTRLQGKQEWWVTYITDTPIDVDFDPAQSSFQTYLDELDSNI